MLFVIRFLLSNGRAGSVAEPAARAAHSINIEDEPNEGW
jgi:hypothetical protein